MYSYVKIIIYTLLIACVTNNTLCFLGPGPGKNRKKYAKPALPYGPKDQKPWYKGRSFEASDFQEQSAFESQREETKRLRSSYQTQVRMDDTLLSSQSSTT